MALNMIGLSGLAGSGKNTVGEMMFKLSPHARLEAFANPIKQMLSCMGLTGEQLDGHEKEIKDPLFGHTPRHMMQTLGTEWGRELICDDVWVKVLHERTARFKGLVIVTDVRTELEADYCRRRGAIIHIVRPGIVRGSHRTECGLKIMSDDYVLNNIGTLDELGLAVQQLYKGILFDKSS